MSNIQITQPTNRRLSIRGLMPRLPERGKIKIGMKGATLTSQHGNKFQPPMKLDHFMVTTLERGRDGNFLRDEEFHRRFGDKPIEIPIRLLYDEIDLNFMTRYACFLGRTLWCSGDGASAIRISEAPPKTRNDLEQLRPQPREVHCTCERQEPAYVGRDKCKMNGNLSCIIDGSSGLGGVWNFRTTSFNTITGLLSSMTLIRSVTGGILANIPLRLRLRAKQATSPTDGSQVLIYVVGIEFAGDIEELQQIGHQIALNRATTHISIAQIEDEARRRLSYMPQDTALPGDDNNEVVEEFYPEQAAAETTASKAAMVADDKTPSDTGETEEDLILPREDETSAGYFLIDTDGAEREFDSASDAATEFRLLLDDGATQRGIAGIEACWENNASFISALREAGEDTLADELAARYHELMVEADNKDVVTP